MDIKKALPKIRENISLTKYSTFKIGGKTKYFFIARKKEDLIKAVKVVKTFKLPFFILGRGSNILFSDRGFRGVIIKIKNQKSKIKNSEIYAEAGVKLDDLAKSAAKKSLAGLEWAAGIPGTVGGAIYGNAEAFGVKTSEVIKKVEVLDAKTLKIKNFSQEQCRFSPKNSVFKFNKNLIIISAILKLKKGNKRKIQERIKEHLSYRKKRHPLNFPSAGSVFVNKEKIKIKDKKLFEKFPELKEFNKKGIIPSAYLIEKCGLKGKRIGDAKISEKHANFILNLGRARTKEVMELIKLAKREVRKKFGVILKEEIQRLF